MTAITVLPITKCEKIVCSLIMAVVCPHSVSTSIVKKNAFIILKICARKRQACKSMLTTNPLQTTLREKLTKTLDLLEKE